MSLSRIPRDHRSIEFAPGIWYFSIKFQYTQANGLFSGCRIPLRPHPSTTNRTHLEEQHEADPLIVGVVFLGRLVVEVVLHAGMGHLHADLFGRNGKNINASVLYFGPLNYSCVSSTTPSSGPWVRRDVEMAEKRVNFYTFSVIILARQTIRRNETVCLFN